jgi:hypothetical protein
MLYHRRKVKSSVWYFQSALNNKEQSDVTAFCLSEMDRKSNEQQQKIQLTKHDNYFKMYLQQENIPPKNDNIDMKNQEN